MSGHGNWKPTSAQKRSWRQRIERRDGPLCWLCGLERGTTLDHVLPRSAGGRWTLSNLKLACDSCNQRRGNDPSWRPAPIGGVT